MTLDISVVFLKYFYLMKECQKSRADLKVWKRIIKLKYRGENIKKEAAALLSWR